MGLGLIGPAAAGGSSSRLHSQTACRLLLCRTGARDPEGCAPRTPAPRLGPPAAGACAMTNPPATRKATSSTTSHTMASTPWSESTWCGVPRGVGGQCWARERSVCVFQRKGAHGCSCRRLTHPGAPFGERPSRRARAFPPLVRTCMTRFRACRTSWRMPTTRTTSTSRWAAGAGAGAQTRRLHQRVCVPAGASARLLAGVCACACGGVWSMMAPRSTQRTCPPPHLIWLLLFCVRPRPLPPECWRP